MLAFRINTCLSANMEESLNNNGISVGPRPISATQVAKKKTARKKINFQFFVVETKRMFVSFLRVHYAQIDWNYVSILI